ncbi:hypothetical protein NC652_024399 [Populus alba x Populus x berolinensis]|nr:hypothetical protein NC652_024399 [Populus alba x Populus x berolinensis]
MLNLPAFLSLLGIHAGFLDRKILMPITLAFVYIGTTLKDLSDVTHGWSEFSTTRWCLSYWAFLYLTPSEGQA